MTEAALTPGLLRTRSWSVTVRTAESAANAADRALGSADGAGLAVATGDAVIPDDVGSADVTGLGIGDGPRIEPEAAGGAELGRAAWQPATAIKTMTARAVVVRWNDRGRRWSLMGR